MYEEVVVIVSVEERVDSNLTVERSSGNVICGIRKILWAIVFWTSK